MWIAEREKLAFDTMQKARKLSEHAAVAERDYVETLAARYSGEAKPDYLELARNYARRGQGPFRKVSRRSGRRHAIRGEPDGSKSWKLWSPDGQPAENTGEILRVLESVLARDPNHAGANHFYIHAVEASPAPGRALPSAHRLDTMIPQAGHLVHMPAHIYIRTGDYAEAVKANEQAVKADRTYAHQADQEGSLYDLMYHSHNEHFLAAAACMEGATPWPKQPPMAWRRV